jgi:hypothetical protein
MMAGMLRRGAAGLGLALAIGAGTALAQDEPPPPVAEEPAAVSIELNKLEAVEGACRIYLLLQNETEVSFDSLQLELVSFDAQGIISQRVAVDLAPLREGKTLVKLFDVPETPCDQVTRLLLNDALSCSGQEGPLPNCLERLQPTSRAEVEFWK